MSSEPLFTIRSLSASWGSTPVLRDISLEVGPGEFVVLMGPNGSGKTTLLRTIAGFQRSDSGEIRFHGRSITELSAHRRGIGILFQEAALFPRRTAWENVAYGLELARIGPAGVQARVSELFDLLHLRGLEARTAEALSGGERQRVALARTLAPGPSLVLLDEPFAAVDPEIRSEMRGVFRAAMRKLKVAAIHVTHDREEGLLLADRVLLLLEGRLVQAGSPGDVFHAPGTAAVARFLGYNVVRDGSDFLAVHPSQVRLSRDAPGHAGEVEASGIVGSDETVIVRLRSGELVEARGPSLGNRPTVGAQAFVRWEGGLRLRGS